MNKNNKIIFFSILTTGILLGIILLCYFAKNDSFSAKSAEEGEVTRYEWMKMLCEQTGITEYQNEIAYFPDVSKDNDYFPYLQSAVEWGILNPAGDFDGEECASGKFVALTAMKTINERKFQILLDTKKALTDNDYIELAIEHELINKKQQRTGISKEQCEQILEMLERLYFGEYWRDDYASVVYQDGVLELRNRDVLQINDDCSEIVVTDAIKDSLATGTVIVFENSNTKLQTAREITRIDTNGVLSLTSVELDRVVESLVVSDITELTFEDIINYYEPHKVFNGTNRLTSRRSAKKILNTHMFPFDMDNSGFELSVSTKKEDKSKEKYLKIQITDNSTKISYELPETIKVEADSGFSAKVNVDKIHVGGQVSYSCINGLEYADVAAEAHVTCEGNFKVEKEQKIPLFKTPVPLGNGLVNVDIQFYLVLSLNGEISLKAELPLEAAVNYEKNRGLRKYERDISFKTPQMEINCDAAVVFRFEPTLIILEYLKVVDVEADIGVAASAKTVPRPNLQVCTDIGISFPVITLSACRDDDANTLINKLGFSAEWKIISDDNAPHKISLHYEMLPDETTQFVKECTYKEPEETSENTKEESFVHTYHTRYGEVNLVDEPVFSFDYPDNWKIIKEEVNGNSTVFGELAGEVVEIENERGVKISFINFDMLGSSGGRGHYYAEYKAEKKTDVVLTWQDDETGDETNYVVAKLILTGEMITDADSDIQPADRESVSYAIMAEEDIDKYGGSLSAMGALIGYYDMISFEYPGPHVFCAESPDGQFTEGEEKEVIAILSSLRAEWGY